MKKLTWLIGLFLVGIVTVSCLDDEPTTLIKYRYSPIDSVKIDTVLPARQVTEIKTYFTTTNDCQSFFDYQHTVLNKELTIAIITSEEQGGNCREIMESKFHTLKFRPESKGVYTFRFWNGTDENGQDLFIVREITVP